MDRLDEALAGDRHSLGTYVGAAAFLAGLVLVGIGALSVLMDSLAGVVPTGVGVGIALATAGAAVTTVLFVAIRVLHDRPADRRVRAGLAGSALSVALVVPIWAAAPGVLGTAGLLLVGLLFFASSFTLTGVVFESAIETDGPSSSGRTSYVRDTGVGGPSPGVADGGSDDDLEFLLDEDDER